MMTDLPKLVATSVVRGSEKGQSHGGVYVVDFNSLRSSSKKSTGIRPILILLVGAGIEA